MEPQKNIIVQGHSAYGGFVGTWSIVKENEKLFFISSEYYADTLKQVRDEKHEISKKQSKIITESAYHTISEDTFEEWIAKKLFFMKSVEAI
jgi:hypothetical protein